MNFFAVLCALLIEQVRPQGPDNAAYRAVLACTRWSGRNFDAGQTQHGWVAWALAVLLPTTAALAAHWLLALWVGLPFAVLWDIGVLYLTLGFRQFSHRFTAIRTALDIGDDPLARALLARWHSGLPPAPSHEALLDQVVAHSVITAHRQVFGVLTWFTLLAMLGLGPAGAVLYRVSEFVARYWQEERKQVDAHPRSNAACRAAGEAWAAIDWLPARVTALGFAMVGSFEEAMQNWRAAARDVDVSNDRILLAATSGAVARSADRDSEVARLRSVVGLVWRSVVMWVVLLALLTLARLLG